MWDPIHVPENGDEPFTDLTRWRLTAEDNGRHIWDYLESDEACQIRAQTVMDKHMLGIPTVSFRYVRVLFIDENQESASTSSC